MGRKSQFSPESRERAVRMLEGHRPEYRTQWDAICSIPTMIDQLERENRELRRANEILRLASAYFAQAELDRLPKR